MEDVRCPERSRGRAQGERLSGRSPSRLDCTGMGLNSVGSFPATICASHHFNFSPFRRIQWCTGACPDLAVNYGD
ncbi:hypothetical protein QQ045_009670 [Rhodiola kirilowii]